jgi:hypothetical protein
LTQVGVQFEVGERRKVKFVFSAQPFVRWPDLLVEGDQKAH